MTAQQTAHWLCVHLNRLALDVVSRALEDSSCLAVSDSHGSKRWIHDCDRAAGERGVRTAMGLATAYALAPELSVHPRHRGAEQRALQQAAAWCYCISSRISPQPPDMVLVEIGASRRLLGQVCDFQERIGEGLQQLGYRSRLAAAPTPAAARLLARAGRYRSIQCIRTLPKVLAGISVDACEWPAAVAQSFHSLGVHDLAAVLRLPRDGLQRRFGRDLIGYLERLLGDMPEPLPQYRPPERFAAKIELPSDVETSEALLFPIQRLLAELSGFLVARDRVLNRFRILLEHPHGERTEVGIGLMQPDRDPQRMLELVRERFVYLSLAAPVRALELAVDDVFPYQAQYGDLLQPHPEKTQQLYRLLERLRSRLGPRAVFALARSADHRPEKAWRQQDLQVRSDARAAPLAQRPLWLLSEPLALSRLPGSLLCGPERIESGWWDHQDVSRDYYTAAGRPGERLWVFRDRRSKKWYLHGVFG